MAKKKVVKKGISQNKAQQMAAIMNTDTQIVRRELLQRLLYPNRNIDNECQYPETLSITDYKEFFDRHGLAKRVVEVWPEECWQLPPDVIETEDNTETVFEKELKVMLDRLPLWNLLLRADILSGIGEFGVILLGLNDGKDLVEPVDGINERGEKVGGAKRELLFLQVFDQSVATIKQSENNPTNPRYGHPTEYNLTFTTQNKTEMKSVHWSRVIHLADNRLTNDVLGMPRMKAVYNNLLDVKKIGGGSGEMFWKGGFPGYSFELSPEAQAANATVDEESMQEQLFLWGQGLQRWLFLTGVNAKSLQPQVADPSGHLDWHVKLIAMALGVPYRILMGTEEAKLAGAQDKKAHNGRVARRRDNYLTPMVVRPFFNRLIALGCLPEPKEYIVNWPDLEAPAEKDIAEVAKEKTEAFSKYVAGGVDALIPPRSYLLSVHKMTEEEVDAIEKERDQYQSELDAKEEEEMNEPQPGNRPPNQDDEDDEDEE